MAYTMEYAEVEPSDEAVEDQGVRVLIDPKAVLFLLGTEMGYKVEKLAAQFVFNNPNQTSACGCGESVQLTPATAHSFFARIESRGGRHSMSTAFEPAANDAAGLGWRALMIGFGPISRKMPSRCIFFFSTLRAWSTLLSRTRTCMRHSSSIERLKGQITKAPGPLAHGYAQSGCRWHP
jgi:hypothetical protein